DNSVYGHANGESRQVLGETDNALRTAGMCPRCRLLTVKAGDEAIDRPDRVAEAITFAVDSGAKVITGVIASTGLIPEIAQALRADEVKQVVRSTVSPIDDPTLPFPGLPGATFNIQYGYGRPNVYRAVRAVHAGRIPPTADILQPDWYQEVDPTVRSALNICPALPARNPGR